MNEIVTVAIALALTSLIGCGAPPDPSPPLEVIEQAAAEAPPCLVLSEFSTTGDYLELANRCDAPVALEGYALAWCDDCERGVVTEEPLPPVTLWPEQVAVVVGEQADRALAARSVAETRFPFPLQRAVSLVADRDVLDTIGEPMTSSPQRAGWMVAGVAGATRGEVLTRRCDVREGQPRWGDAAGEDEVSSSWRVGGEATPGEHCPSEGLSLEWGGGWAEPRGGVGTVTATARDAGCGEPPEVTANGLPMAPEGEGVFRGVVREGGRVTVVARSRCDGRATQREAEVWLDLAPPVLVWPELGQLGLPVGGVVTVPPGTTLAFFGLGAIDWTSGLAQVRLMVESEVLVNRRWEPRGEAPGLGELAPQLGVFACAHPDCAGLSYPLREGRSQVTLSAVDVAGNTTRLEVTVEVAPPPPEGESAPCEAPARAVAPFQGDPLAEGLPARIVDVCMQGWRCGVEGRVGCQLLSQVGMNRLLLNLERALGGGALGELEALRHMLVADARAVVLGELEALPPDASAEGVWQAREALVQADDAQATTAAMSHLEEALFWVKEAAPAPRDLEGCDRVEALRDNLADEEDPGGALVEARGFVEEVHRWLCDPGLSEGVACYDQGQLRGISGVMGAVEALQKLRASAPGAPGSLIWTRNWQMAGARIAQERLVEALTNAEGWAAAEAVAPGFDVVLTEAQGRWLTAEAVLEGGDLDGFIARLTDPAARCLMFEAFEHVYAWWADAQDAACDPLPFPATCFDAEGRNVWPLHGVQF